MKFSSLLGIIVIIEYAACNPVCYECQRIPYPRDCDRVRRCGPHERCYTSQYISTSGAIWYDTGCFPVERCVTKRSISDVIYTNYTDDAIQDDDIITCDQCCHGDFCNSHGCGSQPLPQLSTRGPVCFSCHQQATHESCDVITTCKHGERCYLLPHVHGTLDTIYSTGCMTDAQCDTLQALPSLIGKRQLTTRCGGCCERDYCNQNCNAFHNQPINPVDTTPTQGHITLKSTRETTTSSTTTTTTRITTTTTTHAQTTTTASKISPSTTKRPPTQPSTMSSSTTASPYIDQASCNHTEYTFVPYYNLCYKLYRVKVTWQVARDACIKDGGDLIAFNNFGEKTYFDHLSRRIYANVNQYERRFWVGATDQAAEGRWKWVDGSPVRLGYFHPNEPNNAYDGEDCGAMTYFHTDNHTWINDDACDVHSEYMCQLQLKSHVTSHQPCVNSDYIFVPELHLCYKIYKDNPKTWQEAKDYCELHSAHLLVLAGIAWENYFINAHFYDVGDNTHRYWLGGNDFAQRHKFVWYNGAPLSAFLTWNQGEPNDYQHNERCLDFTAAFGKLGLNDDVCSKKLYFICEEHRIQR